MPDKSGVGFELDPGGAAAAASQELSLLAAPPDPGLMERYTLTDVAPRVAVVSALYQVAVAAGLAADYLHQEVR